MSRPAVTEPRPCVVPYLYVHAEDERFHYPSSRVWSGAGRLANRYLECVLVQAASLRLRGAPCDIELVTNLTDRTRLDARGRALLERIESFAVVVLHAEYDHRPAGQVSEFAASRYVFDAIEAAASGQPADRPLWLVDVDCVWLDPRRALAALPPAPAIGCLHLLYPPDWDLYGHTPASLRALAVRLGAPDRPVDWVGGELLAGRAADLQGLAAACTDLDREVSALSEALTTEEQVVTLAAALGRVETRATDTVWRIWTGRRHNAPPHPRPLELAIWHLPAEKGLSLRRTADELLAGRTDGLRRDLQAPGRAARRFNVCGTGMRRRLTDDAWLRLQRFRDRDVSRGRT